MSINYECSLHLLWRYGMSKGGNEKVLCLRSDNWRQAVTITAATGVEIAR